METLPSIADGEIETLRRGYDTIEREGSQAFAKRRCCEKRCRTNDGRLALVARELVGIGKHPIGERSCGTERELHERARVAFTPIVAAQSKRFGERATHGSLDELWGA